MNIYRGRSSKDFFLAALLYSSIEDQDLGSVTILLRDRGADPNIVLPKCGLAPFHLVIGSDSAEFALQATVLMLRHGGNPNVKSEEGLTPLHIAAAWGRDDILKFLLVCGGDPEIYDLSNKSPMDYAADESHTKCLNLLKSFLADRLKCITQPVRKEYEFILDRILIENNSTLAEYEVIPKQIKEDNATLKNLKCLPEVNTTELVSKWCEKQKETINTIYTKPLNSTGETPVQSDYDGSVCESDGGLSRPFDLQNLRFKKVYRKKRKINGNKNSLSNQSRSKSSINKATTEESPQSIPAENKSNSFEISSLMTPYSKESGIMTLSDSFKESPKEVLVENIMPEIPKDTSSDYMTCSFKSEPNILEKNVFEITDDLSSNTLITPDESKCDKSLSLTVDTLGSNTGTELSFISVSEVYKYVDEGEGVVLYERRLLKTPTGMKSDSSLTSLPNNLDYDTDVLRRELTLLGYNPGPITSTTKQVYLKKLRELQKRPAVTINTVIPTPARRVYSIELEKTLRDSTWLSDLALYKTLEDVLFTQFSNPDPSRKWREGTSKTSFTYLLLDPRITNNLPCRSDSLKLGEIWNTFLSSIFYVGKGKRSRPYSHLYEAVTLWNQGKHTSSNKKLQRILNIWRDKRGVVCLHVFQNIIPVEAYTREAAMISALKVENVDNVKQGDFYGTVATWPQKQKKMLGVFLLYKAMQIFLNEGERQICPSDIL